MGKKKNVVKVEEKEHQKEEINSEPVDDEIKEEPEEEVSQVKRNKHARLIIRNLSFKATEDKVRKFFSSYGELTDVQILKRPDGRLVGCCFVEYALKTSAAKAIAHASGKPFLNRPVVVDWAVPKDKFLQKTSKTVTDDSEESGFHEDEEKIKVKKEGSDEDEENSEKNDSDESGTNSDEDDDNEDRDDDDSDDDDDDDDDHDNQDIEDEEARSEDDGAHIKRRKPLRESHDISEGCTIFVKNLPFSVDNQELRKCMSKFGPIYYALVCIDPLTEHSKGTGFVKFKTKEVAEACLNAGRDGEIVIKNTVLEVQPAVSREDLHQGSKKKNETKKDGRNLYLIKEGVILAGSPAASGVSPADMAKRLQLEQWKTQMLRNLNKFVSRNRLVIQNLPASYDDQKLRSLCLKHGGTNAVITEARVMRDLRNVDANGKGKSKEFGFVSFTNHENALQALRALNNNPDVFTSAKRPIVAFSIEDKKVLNIRQKRIEKSRAGLKLGQNHAISQKDWESRRREEKQNNANQAQNNSRQKDSKASSKSNPTAETKLTKKEKRQLKRKKLAENQQAAATFSENTQSHKFMGETAKQGQVGVMSRQKLREQAELQSKMMKSKNKKERSKKQLAAVKIKQPKQKMAKPKDLRKEDNFSKLVNKYKSKLASSEVERKKWYAD
ncbi:RNA-binding protein 28 [Frankliniella fusca]|uniref:RNA-binding protein 28 n=1 Tax=Frankliniella fusca TaxID=407009 RepID=A0AAE1HUJ0_9NEOP|nr:RNA-binding protein 28 [Frankliniella fusca]